VKRVVVILVVVALLGTAGWLWQRHRVAEAARPEYETAPVVRDDVSSHVTATGTLSPLVTVAVGSQVSGRIQSLGADFNSRVSKGQVIARLDPQLFEADVARQTANLAVANAALRRAEAELADAQRRHERAARLAVEGVVGQQDADAAVTARDAAEAGVAAARASVRQAEAALQQARTNLAYTTILSPIDGIVISRDVDVGQTVAASLSAPVLFTIAEDLRQMELHTNVAESDVGQLREGMTAEFTVDAWPAARFSGVVKEVRYSPQTVQNVVTYDAVISVENPELKLRPGMTADVSFVVAERHDVLVVPNAALRFQPPAEVSKTVTVPDVATGGERRGPRRSGDTDGRPGAPAPARQRWRIAWVLPSSQRPEPVKIRTGLTDGRNTEVLEGVEEGTLVITGLIGAEPAATGARPGSPRFGRIL
jgi:HlyD family secretion protein